MEWISVRDKLPLDENGKPLKKDFLVYDDINKRMAVSCYFTLNNEDYFWENRDDQNMLEVTHWMPLPTPP